MKHFTHSKLLSLLLFICLIINTDETNAQPSTANYIFTHATNGSLTDMSIGTMEIIGPNSSTSATQTHSTVQDIGFNFVFMGQQHSQFGVSSRGTMRLGANSSGSIGTNNLNTTSSNLLPLIAPFWDALGTSSTGKVHYKVTGEAPNRVLVVEWLNMRIAVTGSTGADGTFQLRLYESTGKLEFVYGSMNIGSGSPVVTASIGFTTGNVDNNKLSISSITSPAVITTGTMVNDLVNSSTPGPITGLNSINANERVIYTFTPPTGTPSAPTNITFTNIGDNSLTLNWTDNATNESGYLVENVNDGIVYPFLPANSTSFEASGLSLQTNYTFRVYAVTEAAASPGLEGSQATTNTINLPATGAYNFTHTTNGSLTDMNSATTEIIGPNSATGSSDVHSTVQDIGFNFVFMAQLYAKFGVSSRGTLRLGANSSGNAIGSNNLNTTTANFLPLIAPFWDGLGTSSTGKVHYKVTGEAPNRVLVVEWLNMRIAATGSTGADGTFQLRLYENGGKIEFVYGEMNIGTGSPLVTASIGFTTGNTINNLLSLRSISTPIFSAVPVGVINNLVNSNIAGPIIELNSSNNNERVVYTFTPPNIPPISPTNLTFTNISDDGMTLNWIDNATNEMGYVIENVNDGIIIPLPSNSTSYTAAGLSLQTNYNWRVYAVGLASVGSALDGSEETSNINNLPTTGAYNFEHFTNGSLTDMSSDAVQLIGPSSDFGTSALENIGFDFYFMGTRYNNFGVTANGILRLGGTISANEFNNLNTTSELPIITPFWDYIGTSSSGSVRYKTTGTTPNRLLVVEWFNMSIARAGSSTSDGTFQLRLHESSGKMEFVYGSMNIGEGSPVVTASIGFTKGNSVNNLLSVRSISPPIVSAVPAGVNNNLVSGSTPGPISGLNSISNGERVIYSFTPAIPSPPTTLSFTNITVSSMTLNWTPASNAKFQAVYISTDNVSFEHLATIPASQAFYDASTLNPSTTYYWRIYSLTEGGVSTPLEGSQITNGGSYAGGTKTIGATGDYLTLQAAFNDMNSLGLTGAVLLELQANYDPTSETYPINAGSLPGSSEANSVVLRPASGVTGITFTSGASQTFNLSHTKFLTIDGRPGGVFDAGSTSEITISNTSTTGNAIRLNDAPNNTIMYCKVNGVNVTTLGDGVIRVSGSGNDNLAINNCDIGDGVTPPANLIYVGDGLNVNVQSDSISIINCKLFNNSGHAIWVVGNGNGYTVSGNSFYRTRTETNLFLLGVRFIPSGISAGHIIKDNFIGGSDVNCQGDPLIGASLVGIELLTDNSSSSLIQNNTIQNFVTGSSTFRGIEVSGTGHTITGNILGHNIISNSIVNNSGLTGISLNSSSSVTVSNNLIANLTATGTGTSHGVVGIFVVNNSGCLIENNVIRSLTSNSTSADINSQGAMVGIGVGNTSFDGKIRGNSIHNLVSIPGGTGTANTSVLGIIIPGSNTEAEALITGNRIFDLRNLSAGTNPNVFGITGISGKGVITNNQISIDNGSFSTNPVNIRGINLNVTDSENIWDVFYNSINISGETFSESLVSSSFYKQNTNTVNLKNNLFYNNRTGGTGGHYAAAFENNTNVTSDYNLFVAPSNVALWGATPFNFADYKTNSGLDGFSYSTDPTTITTANLFVDAANGNLNINAGNDAAYYVDGKGIPIEGISGDFTDSTGVRNTLISEGTTDIGSDEFDYTGTIPNLTASGPPALNTTTTYSFAGRQLGSITWGSTGTVPSSITVMYHSGINPPGILVGEYSKGYWDFTPTGGSGFTYDITLNYTPAILHNIANENNLKMAKYDGEPWLYFSDATVNTTNKTVTKTGLTSFSAFTLTSSDNPLPVELSSFTANIDRRDVYLSWSTASEINNSGFDVERSIIEGEIPNEWSKISFIDGNGTTSETKNYTFTDRGLNTGKYNYRLKQIDYNGNIEYFNLSNEVIIGVPDKYDLSQNYPNPFNPVTKINFDLPFDSKVTMKIFDITGREIATLVNNVQPAGYYTVTFDAKNIASGMYFYRIIAEGGNQNYVMTKKMVVIK